MRPMHYVVGLVGAGLLCALAGAAAPEEEGEIARIREVSSQASKNVEQLSQQLGEVETAIVEFSRELTRLKKQRKSGEISQAQWLDGLVQQLDAFNERLQAGVDALDSTITSSRVTRAEMGGIIAEVEPGGRFYQEVQGVKASIAKLVEEYGQAIQNRDALSATKLRIMIAVNRKKLEFLQKRLVEVKRIVEVMKRKSAQM